MGPDMRGGCMGQDTGVWGHVGHVGPDAGGCRGWGVHGAGRGGRHGSKGGRTEPEAEQQHHGVLGGSSPPTPLTPSFRMGNLLVINVSQHAFMENK